jgi:hypothetical protein
MVIRRRGFMEPPAIARRVITGPARVADENVFTPSWWEVGTRNDHRCERRRGGDRFARGSPTEDDEMRPLPLSVLTMTRARLTATLLLLLAGCREGATDGSAAPDAAAPGEGVLRGPCPLERAAGFFEVEMGDRFTSVSGRVLASAPPRSPPRQEGAQGGCQLLRPVNPFCDPACGGEELCGPAGRCVTAPRGLALGTVTITGLKKIVVMEPRLPSNEYFDVTLPHPGYEVGAAIALHTSGGEVPSFRLHGRGVAPLEPLTSDWTLDPAKDLVVTWTGASAGGRVRLQIDVDRHGSSPVGIGCLVEDRGSLTLEAALLAKLLTFGVSGFPTATLTRGTDDSIDAAPGCVGLAVSSRVTVPLKVVGHIPCNPSSPCPEGKTCDLRNETCR